MAEDFNDDGRLFAALGEAVRARREVPARFVEMGKAAFTWHNVDAELATLAYDSAAGEPVGDMTGEPVGAMVSELVGGTRAEPAELRALTFVASRLTIELEVAPDALLGQLVPPQQGAVELHGRDGVATTTRADDVGWFTFRPLPSGLFRLRVRPDAGGPVVTEWAMLG
jgi:hypothetical protein